MSQSLGLKVREDHSGAKLQWWEKSIVFPRGDSIRIVRARAPVLRSFPISDQNTGLRVEEGLTYQLFDRISDQ